MKIFDLMYRIRLREISLPEFQREYVWTIEQACELLRSLYRGYPTGSLLFWNTITPPVTRNATDTPPPGGSQLILLDGQQRLTALYLLTQGEPPPYYTANEIQHDPRTLLFDLATGHFDYARSSNLRPTWVPVTKCFRDQPDPMPIAQQMMGAYSNYDIAKVVEGFLVNRSRLQNILERDYPTETVPPSASLDDAIDVFDRINSQGTKLSAAELALTHISSKWPEARQTMKQTLDALALQRFRLNLDFLVRTLVGVINGRARLDTIHNTPAETLKAGWQQMHAALMSLPSLLMHHAAMHTSDDIASLDTLIPIIVHLAQRNGHSTTIRRAIHWLYLANIWSRYSSESNQRLDYDLSLVQRAPDPWTDLEEAIIAQGGRATVHPSDLEGRGEEHPLYRTVRVVLKAQGAVDWFTQMPLAAAHTLHSQQIFPDELFRIDDRMQRRYLDEIANQAFLVSTTTSSLFAQLGAIEACHPDTLSKHGIPLNSALWQPSQFQAFLAERRRLLAEAINKHLQAMLVAPAPAQSLTLPDLLTNLIKAGESVGMELKSSLRWDVKRKTQNNDLEQEVVKTIAAFLNTEGGILLIGVEDDGNIFGIERDLKLLQPTHQNLDGFEVEIRKLVNERMGAEYNRYIRSHFGSLTSKTVCIIKVYPSPRPVMCTHKGGQGTATFFVRTGNLTQSLTPAAMNSYVSLHWAS